MMHLVNSSKSNGKISVKRAISESCHDDRSISCFPLRMHRLGIPAVLRSLQLKLRGPTSVTSQSDGRRHSLYNLLGKCRSTLVVPLNLSGEEPTVLKSVGLVTDHFAKLNVCPVRSKTRCNASQKSVRQNDSYRGLVECDFSLPGSVCNNEDKPCDNGEGTQAAVVYNEPDTGETSPGKADRSREIDIPTIKENGDAVERHFLDDQKPLNTALEENLKSSSSCEEYFRSERDHFCEPEFSLENGLKENNGKPDKGEVPSTREDTTPLGVKDTTYLAAKIPYADEDNLDEEMEFFDRTSEERDHYIDIDDILQQCPNSEVIRNLQSAVTMSKCATRQLERALKKWSRITRGPFPRQPGSGKTKVEVIDAKTVGLRTATAEYIEEMNKVFFNFYCVTEELDDIEEKQGRLV